MLPVLDFYLTPHLLFRAIRAAMSCLLVYTQPHTQRHTRTLLIMRCNTSDPLHAFAPMKWPCILTRCTATGPKQILCTPPTRPTLQITNTHMCTQNVLSIRDNGTHVLTHKHTYAFTHILTCTHAHTGNTFTKSGALCQRVYAHAHTHTYTHKTQNRELVKCPKKEDPEVDKVWVVGSLSCQKTCAF